MNFYDSEEAVYKRVLIIREQHGVCGVCGKLFTDFNPPEIAHRIPKHKKWLKKYGKEIIHHRLNLVATCKNCNSSVLVNPATLPGKALIAEIRQAISC